MIFCNLIKFHFLHSWEQRKLGDIVQITMGQSPNGETYSEEPSTYILVQGNADLNNGWVVPRVWTTQLTKQADKGDLIMSVRAPAGTMGKTAYNVVIGRGVAAIKGNEFIFQSLVKMDESGYWKRLSTGSTFESLNSDNIKNAIMYVPSKEEQSKIGTNFSNLDNLITLHQRECDHLKELKKSMLKKMFPRDGSSFPEVRFAGFTDAWEQRKLIDLCDYVDYRGKTPNKSDSGIFLVTAKNVKDGYIDYDVSKEYIPEDKYEEVMRRGKPKIGDVLITTEAPCGNVAQVNKPNIALAQRIIKYRGHNQVIDNTYLKYYLLSPFFQNILNMKSSGGTVQGIKGSVLHQQKISFTKYTEQLKIGQCLDSLDSLITLHQRELEILKNLKKTCLKRMFI
jgi:type I restriction enzyme S subunit